MVYVLWVSQPDQFNPDLAHHFLGSVDGAFCQPTGLQPTHKHGAFG